MKSAKLLIWITQLGLSLAIPLASFVFLGCWLHYSLGWGKWVLITGILLGIVTGAQSLLQSLKTMERMAPPEEKDTPTSFNDHT